MFDTFSLLELDRGLSGLCNPSAEQMAKCTMEFSVNPEKIFLKIKER